MSYCCYLQVIQKLREIGKLEVLWTLDGKQVRRRGAGEGGHAEGGRMRRAHEEGGRMRDAHLSARGWDARVCFQRVPPCQSLIYRPV